MYTNIHLSVPCTLLAIGIKNEKRQFLTPWRPHRQAFEGSRHKVQEELRAGSACENLDSILN